MQRKQTMGELVLHNLAPYQNLEGIGDAELEQRAGLDEGYLSKLRSHQVRQVGVRVVMKLATYFGVAPATISGNGSKEEGGGRGPMPTAATYFMQQYGLADPQFVSVLEGLAEDLAHLERLAQAAPPLDRKSHREMRELLLLWMRLSPDQREPLLGVARQLARGRSDK